MFTFLGKHATLFIIYWVFIIILLKLSGATCLWFLGGISPQNNSINLIAIIKWNLLIFPPIVTFIIYESKSKVGLGILEMIRYGSLKRIWRKNIIVCICINYLFFIIPVMFCLIIETKLVLCNLYFIIEIIVLLPIFTSTLTIICTNIANLSNSYSLVIGVYIFFGGITPIVLIAYPECSKYIFTAFGMVLRTQDHYTQGFQIGKAILVILAANLLMSLVYLKVLNTEKVRR